jgi:hypothetical protein
MSYKTLLLASAVLALAGFTTGCGDVCGDAADKAEECGLTVRENEDVECTGEAECQAECFNEASCEEITDLTANGAFAQCTAACAE